MRKELVTAIKKEMKPEEYFLEEYLSSHFVFFFSMLCLKQRKLFLM